MVKRLLAAAGLGFILLLLSCDFLLLTPFPVDLAFYDSYLDLASIVPGQEETYNYRMGVVGEYLLLIVDRRQLYVFRADTLEFVTERSGSFENLAMQEASGAYIIGNQRFDAEMANPSTDNGQPIDQYGFSRDGSNYLVSWDGSDLFIDVFDSAWAAPVNYSYSTSAFRSYKYLMGVFCDQTAGSGGPVYLVFCFRRTDDDKLDVIRAPLATVLGAAAYPFGLEDDLLVFPSVAEENLMYAGKWFVLYEDGDDFLYYFDGGSDPLKWDFDRNDVVITFDPAGEAYYRFDVKLKRLYKTRVYW